MFSILYHPYARPNEHTSTRERVQLFNSLMLTLLCDSFFHGCTPLLKVLWLLVWTGKLPQL